VPPVASTVGSLPVVEGTLISHHRVHKVLPHRLARQKPTGMAPRRFSRHDSRRSTPGYDHGNNNNNIPRRLKPIDLLFIVPLGQCQRGSVQRERLEHSQLKLLGISV
jgi:hypothetical protein